MRQPAGRVERLLLQHLRLLLQQLQLQGGCNGGRKGGRDGGRNCSHNGCWNGGSSTTVSPTEHSLQLAPISVAGLQPKHLVVYVNENETGGVWPLPC